MYETKLIPQGKLPKEYVSIHTTDRIVYRRCRRKWSFSSQLKHHLRPKDATKNEKFWMGSGIHFALEDYHGYNIFGSPTKAFEEYIKHTVKDEPSDTIEALIDLGHGMLDYYINSWLPKHDKFETYWVNNEPQVEVEISILLGEVSNYYNFPIIYQMKYDRVVKDKEYGRLWVMDYKTAVQFNVSKLETDPQVTAYCWGFPYKYDVYAEGMIYNQLKKDTPSKPRILKNGSISKDKKQSTTYDLYFKALKDTYGSKVPASYKDTLDSFKKDETELTDNFIRYDLVRRNKIQALNEYQKITAETLEMMDTDLALYPNPTKDCSWDCDYQAVCLSMDDGSDYEHILKSEFKEREEEGELPWVKKIRKSRQKKKKKLMVRK